MLISLPRRPERYVSITSANSGWSCSWIRGTRAMDSSLGFSLVGLAKSPSVMLISGRGLAQFCPRGRTRRRAHGTQERAFAHPTVPRLLHLEARRLHDRHPARQFLGDELSRRLRARIQDWLQRGGKL